jgi:hypothetical protein
MLQAFIENKLRGRSLALVAIANEICADYARQGYDLTLRQLYYQFVARGHIPNTMQSYKSLGYVIDQARLAGLLDWAYIVDRTRNVYRTDGADTAPEDAVEAAARGYGLELWEDQPNHVEVWIYADYQTQFGDDSWELDALDPATLSELITTEVLSLRDEDLWEAAHARQETDRARLQLVSTRWADVETFLEELDA